MKTALALSLGLLIAGAATASAQAHAALWRAEPTVNGVAHEAPSRLQLVFTEAIAVKLSGATLAGAGGAIDADKAAPVAGDAKALTVALKAPLNPGVYTVRWHAVASDDGHRTQGTYRFTVK